MLRLPLLLTALATPIAQPANAQEQSPIALQEHGVICTINLQGQQPAPDTETGHINVIDETRGIDVFTDQVPAHLGLSFGIRTVLSKGAILDGVRISVTHPPMGPERITQQSWEASLHSGASALNLFTFEDTHELVQGTWIFQLTFAGNILSEQRFEVTPPGSVPTVQYACQDDALTS